MKTRNNPRNGATDYIRPWTATRWPSSERVLTMASMSSMSSPRQAIAYVSKSTVCTVATAIDE